MPDTDTTAMTDDEVAALRTRPAPGPDRTRWDAWACDAELQWLRRRLGLVELSPAEARRADLYESLTRECRTCLERRGASEAALEAGG